MLGQRMLGKWAITNVGKLKSVYNDNVDVNVQDRNIQKSKIDFQIQNETGILLPKSHVKKFFFF